MGIYLALAYVLIHTDFTTCLHTIVQSFNFEAPIPKTLLEKVTDYQPITCTKCHPRTPNPNAVCERGLRGPIVGAKLLMPKTVRHHLSSTIPRSEFTLVPWLWVHYRSPAISISNERSKRNPPSVPSAHAILSLLNGKLYDTPQFRCN